MDCSLSENEIREYKEILEKAEPYTHDELSGPKPDMEFDQDRLRATSAKYLLDMYYQHHPEEKENT